MTCRWSGSQRYILYLLRDIISWKICVNISCNVRFFGSEVCQNGSSSSHNHGAYDIVNKPSALSFSSKLSTFFRNNCLHAHHIKIMSVSDDVTYTQGIFPLNVSAFANIFCWAALCYYLLLFRIRECVCCIFSRTFYF